MNRYSKMGIALLAGTWLLVGCGGGGGGSPGTPGDTPVDNGGQPSGENGTSPSNENGTPPPGGTPPGTTTGTGTGTTTGTTTGTGTGTIINTGGALFGILWPNPDFDSTAEVSEENPEQVPYEFKPSYEIPEDDETTTDVNEREVYITEIERDADYADQTAQDISRQIDDIRMGTDTEGGTPTLVAWQESTLTIIRDAQGISAGLDAAAMEDIAAIDALIARLERLRKQAEMAKEALETARDGEETRLRGEATRLRSRVAALEREIRQHEADAVEKDNDAADREAEIQDADHDGPNIPDLTDEADALNIEINTLKDEIRDDQDERDLVNDWLAHYADGATQPDGDNPAGCTDAATCRARSAELDARLMPKETIIDTKEDEEEALRAQITDLQMEVTDLRTEAQRLRDQVPKKRTNADNLGQEVSDLEGSIPEALAALQAAIDTIEAHITAIEGEKTRVENRHDTDKVAAKPHIPALHVQDLLQTIATQASPTVPSAAHLVRRTSTDFEDLDADAQSDAVFARRPAEDLGGLAPEDVLRAIVRSAQPTVDVAQFVEERELRAPPPTATAGTPEHTQQTEYQTLDTNLGSHWRMPLSGYLLADADFQGTALADIGTARGDSVRVTFRGVHGTVYCATSSCNDLADSATTFNNGWRFTPSLNEDDGRLEAAIPGSQSTRFRYEDKDGDGVYEPLFYVDYGMWLAGDDEDDFDIQARAALIGPDSSSRATPNLTTRASGRNNLGFDSATYSGTARGLSARSQYKESEYVTASGHFLADVELTATFGGTPTLGGTIDNFQSADPAGQGTDHVNPAWSLDLQGWSLDTGDGAGGLGTFDDGDAETQEAARGHWSAWMHGPADRRPDGIYGGFTAAFRDDDIDQNPDGTNGDGSQDPDNNLFDDGAAIGVFSTVRGTR